ncbi:MAG: S8 family serine peptidase [Gaiellaceae bacterium]
MSPAVSALLGCPSHQPSNPTSSSSSAPTSTGNSRTTAATAAAAPAQLQPSPAIATASTKTTYVPNVVVVRFRAGAGARAQAQLLHRIGARTRERIAQLRVAVVSVGSVARAQAKLDASPLVTHATRDEVMHVLGSVPDDAFFSYQWGFRQAGFDTIWQRPSSGRPVIVAVLDTGVDATQPDLAGAVRPEINLISGSTVTGDDNGHGTAVAGVIAALANNGVGGAGVCAACSILPIKVMGSNGNGDLATVAAGIVRAADMHARVIDLSLGGPQGLDALQQAVSYAMSKGAIVIAAAGNSGQATPFFPANYPGVISVAGSNQADHLYGWSEHGTWIAVSAPGCNVAPLLHGGYGQFCGTSSATPLVAGLAGIMVAAHPSVTNTRVASAIERTAKRIRAGVRFGRISAAAALAAAG